MLHTIDELIDFLGGNTALAEMLGIDQSAVSQWKIRRQIGSGWHLRLLSEVRARGADVHPSVFGLSEEEARGLFSDRRAAAVSEAAA